MSSPGESSNVVGLLAALGAVAALGVLAERQRAKRTTPSEVALHQQALAAIEQARASIHAARRAAEALRDHSVELDIEAKLRSAFTEDLAPINAVAKSDQRKLFFVLEGPERLPDLKQAVEKLMRPNPGEVQIGADQSARATLRRAMDIDGGVWTAERAHTALESNGWRSDSERPLNVIGNLLAAMVRDNEIRRTSRGLYAPLHPTGSADESYPVGAGLVAKEPAPGVLLITGADTSSEVQKEVKS